MIRVRFMAPPFVDRAAAGRVLACRLRPYAARRDVVVYALPRGGVPVAWEVARALAAPMDVLIVRKLGVPRRPGLSMGAIASGGAIYVDPQIVADCGVASRQLDAVIAAESIELIRRRALYCGTRAPAPTEGRTVIVVDDGLATGASMQAALKALRGGKPEWIVVAVPVAPLGAQDRIGTAADEFISVLSPSDFREVGEYYRHFSRTTDEEVRELLSRPRSP